MEEGAERGGEGHEEEGGDAAGGQPVDQASARNAADEVMLSPTVELGGIPAHRAGDPQPSEEETERDDRHHERVEPKTAGL